MTKQPHNSNKARPGTAQVPQFGRMAVGALLVSSVFGTLLAAAPAHAFGPGDREPPRREERDHRDMRDVRENRGERDSRSFERAEERRRMMQEAGNAEVSRRVDRMTPDERRDLRRQINEAGQEIYVRPQRR